ncbi:MFS transporter [Pantoea sp. paga]|uniref:MFS transporter n=1 Tax=Pantoea sp. paga TaxID=2597519 RepID=UPI00117F5FA0|nr:MFS transporter [Pantoea sp. paga]TSH84465.1 MFS transporter [Pantoea sp. paga]
MKRDNVLVTADYRTLTVLLGSSLFLTVARGLTLPFISLYLLNTGGYSFSVTGIVLTCSMVTGVLFGIYGSALTDRIDNKKALLAATLVFGISFCLLPLNNSIMWIVISFTLVNCAYPVISTAIKKQLSLISDASARSRYFSLNYTFINIGWVIAPPLAVWLVTFSASLTFFLSGGIALVTALLIACLLKTAQSDNRLMANKSKPNDFMSGAMGMALKDRRLILFTLGSFFISFVVARFSNCASQYITFNSGEDLAYVILGIITPVNAIVVVTLQYFLGSKVNQGNLVRAVWLGAGLYIIALAVFMVSNVHISGWIMGMVVFSIGEIILSPVEYVAVDAISSDELKGTYFGLHNLSTLGGAINPLITGLMLAHGMPELLFPLMIGCMLFSLLCYGFLVPWTERRMHKLSRLTKSM